MKIVFGFVGVLVAVSSSLPVQNWIPYESYDGHQVISIKTSTEAHAQALLGLSKEEGLRDIGFWKEPRKIGGTVDVQIKPEHKPLIEAFLEKHGLKYEVKIVDLGDLVAKEKKALENRTVFKTGDDPKDLTLGQVHNLREIYAYLDSTAKAYNGTASLFSIGKSYEGRSLLGLKIGNPGNNKKAAFMHGCLHSREWIGCASMLYIINELTQNAAKHKTLLDALDVYILPVANPDGYEITWNQQRFWRKTTSGPHGFRDGVPCFGADANRNFDFHFREAGYSDDPCDYEQYAGPYAFSEVESKAIADFLTAHKDTVKAYFDVHAYSELFMYPYGYAKTYPADIEKLRSVAVNATDAINAVNGGQFKQGPIVDIIYAASGSTIDWAKGVLNIPYTYALELAPKDTKLVPGDGFLINFSEVIPAAKECWAGLQVVLNAVAAGK
ncbi:hypothetical protein QR680_003985 [Steinernema hermaphroditum]|uniref:Peptidase M14 domain-containing protein n=1 Tax=Steinernema hermaphroditum TaxID=289476 RepID=A0AA39LSY2_9BILA|nr:hypothetical protein QR680_003985 [Steinernema hermaphroditum]